MRLRLDYIAYNGGIFYFYDLINRAAADFFNGYNDEIKWINDRFIVNHKNRPSKDKNRNK